MFRLDVEQRSRCITLVNRQIHRKVIHKDTSIYGKARFLSKLKSQNEL